MEFVNAQQVARYEDMEPGSLWQSPIGAWELKEVREPRHLYGFRLPSAFDSRYAVSTELWLTCARTPMEICNESEVVHVKSFDDNEKEDISLHFLWGMVGRRYV